VAACIDQVVKTMGQLLVIEQLPGQSWAADSEPSKACQKLCYFNSCLPSEAPRMHGKSVGDVISEC